MVELVIFNVIRSAIISSIGICLILIFKRTLFKEYTKNFNYYIWLIVIFRMILPFKIPIYISINNSANEINTTSKAAFNIESINNPLINNQVIESAKHFTLNFSIVELLGYLWLAVLLIIIIYRIFTYIKFKNSIVNLSCTTQSSKLKNIYDNLLIDMKINKNILLKVSDYTSVPLGIGFFKSYIILPNIIYKEKEAEWILKHELMHYKKNDILYKFLVMFVTSIYWFNPFIYIMNRYINIDCELACDERILNNCDFKERQSYALTLINSLKHKESNFIENSLATKLGNKKILKRRFDSMFNKKTKNGILIGVIAIIIATCSFGLISTKSSADALEEKEVQATTEKDPDSIQLYQIDNSKYKGYYLEIKDPTRVKIGYTSKLMTEGETTSQIAEDNHAIAAINGGGFVDVSADGVQWTGNGGTPTGIIMTNGKIIYTDLKDDQKINLFALTKEGKLIVGKYSLNDLSNLGAEEALNFGPSLIINSEMTTMSGDGGFGIAPRTAIGQKKDGTIIMLTIDGKSIKNLGATLKEEQEVMFKLGAINAINLDGGKSTSMYYNGNIINTPSYSAGERLIPTAIIVK